MSFLELERGIPNFDQAVISFWFRVPKKSLVDVCDVTDAEFVKAQASKNPYYVYPRMLGIMPLMTFGPLTEGYQIKQELGPPTIYYDRSGTYVNGVYTVFPAGYSQTHQYQHYEFYKTSKRLINPSYIGLRVFRDEKPDVALSAVLRVRLQMQGNGTGEWVTSYPRTHVNDSIALGFFSPGVGTPPPPTETAYDYSQNRCKTDYVFPDGNKIETTTHIDRTELYSKQLGPEAIEVNTNIPVTPNQWHHVLISFDIRPRLMTGRGRKTIYQTADCTGGSARPLTSIVSDEIIGAVTNPCQVWIALDDKNYATNLSGQLKGLDGPNDVVPQSLVNAATAANGTNLYNKAWHLTGLVKVQKGIDDFGLPDYRYTSTKIPSDNTPLGIPCMKSLVQYNHHVEMAEFQMYTGISFDTGLTEKRRAFIDYELDKKGKQVVNPATGTPILKPVFADRKATKENGFSSGSIEYLGREPEILLHKSKRWIAGDNTGSGGKPDFKPTGKIIVYKPDPNLHGDQGKPQ